MARLTYGEMRTNAEKIADEEIKDRILAGIDVLNEKFGPDWVDHVDVTTLDLSSPNACVLGQVYKDAEITPEQERTIFHKFSTESVSGFWRGLVILNGDVEDEAWAFGFDTGAESYEELDTAWVTALGYGE